MPRAFYIVGLIGWTALMLLLPPWEGRSYFGGPGGWGDVGTFGLTTSSAPPWDPPTAYSSAIRATVRWPWQPVTRQHHIELDLTFMAVRWSLGVLALGLLTGGLHWRRARRRQDVPDDVVVRVAVHLSLALAVAWLVLVVIGALSMGMALLPPVVLGVLGAGLAGGLVMALLPWRRTRRGTHASTASVPERGVPHVIAAESPAVLEYEPTRIVARPWAGAIWLFWSLIGLIAAVALAWIALMVAQPFRRSVTGRTVLGGRHYQYDHVVNLATGMSLLIAGWLAFAVMARRTPAPRALRWAFALGTSALGILILFD